MYGSGAKRPRGDGAIESSSIRITATRPSTSRYRIEREDPRGEDSADRIEREDPREEAAATTAARRITAIAIKNVVNAARK